MRRTRRGIVTAGSVLAVAAIAAGCGSSTNSGGSPSHPKSAKSITIGFAQRESDAPYYNAMRVAATAMAKQDGFKLIYQDANKDPVTQINTVQTMLAQGANAVVVDAVSPGTERSQMEVIAKKVPLLFVDTPIPGVGFTAIQSDNVKIGEEAGRLMASRVGRGKTLKLGILNGGPTDVDVGPARRKGFLMGLAQGGVKPDIVGEAEADYSENTAVTKTQDLLTGHPDIQAIFGYNDAMALGAYSVLKNRHNTHVLVAGLDGQKQAMQAIKQNGCHSQYVATGLNSPSLAADGGLKIALAVATGKSKESSFPKLGYTKAVGIGCHNVDQYYKPSSTF